jgi:hypothetical protein
MRLDDKVRRLIQASDCLIVLGTAVAVRSRWVQQEIGCAKALGKHIVPLRTRGARPAAMLEGYEYYSIKKASARQDFRNVARLLRQWAENNGIAVGPEPELPGVDKFFQMIHLPSAVICPNCRKVDHHVAVCFLCGQWVCFACGGTVPPPSPAVAKHSPPPPRIRRLTDRSSEPDTPAAER